MLAILSTVVVLTLVWTTRAAGGRMLDQLLGLLPGMFLPPRHDGLGVAPR